MDLSNAQEQFYGNIYDFINDEEIYLKLLGYIPDTKIKYRSPFSEDNNPSFRFVQRDRLLWQCFSTGKGGDAVSLVSKLMNITYKEAVYHIYNKYPLSRNRITNNKKINTPTIIEVILFEKDPKSFYEYWEDFNVSKETLNLFNIRAAKEVWLTKEGDEFLIATYKDKNPVIRYLINGKYKIYTPNNPKEKKWLSNTKVTDIQGWSQLPNSGDILIISKAMKDILVWKELGINAIALCSETANLHKELVDNISSRFKKVICFLDNDEAGLETMNKYYNKYKIPFTYIPINIGCKDIAEFSQLYGLEELKNFLSNKLNINL